VAQAGLSAFNPLLPPAPGEQTPLNPLVGPPPPAATGLDALQRSLADIATIGAQAQQRIPIVAPQVAPQTAPSIAFSPSRGEFYVQGRTFTQDDAQSALESEALLGQPAAPLPQGGDWVPVDPQSYAAYLGRIKNPSLGTLFTKGVGRGVDSLQLLAGRGLQLLGAEETGAGIVAQQAEDLRRTTPFSRRFTEIESGGDSLEWFVANLGEQIPNLLESVAVAGAGAVGGTFAGGPGVGTLGGMLAGLAGKSAFKQAVLAAARKKAAGEVLDAAESKVLRSAAAIAGATAASFADSYRMGAADIYGELRDQGADPDDVSAKMLSLAGAFPYAAAELVPEFLLAGRIFGGVGAARALPAGTSVRRRGAELLRRGAVGGAIGGVAEGGTEVAQEALLLGLSDQDLSKPENVERLINSFAAGAAIGGPIGAVSNLRGRQPTSLLGGAAEPGPDQLGGTPTTPQLGGPAAPLLLEGPTTAVGPARNVVYRPQTAIGQEQQLALAAPPPGTVLQIEGQPDFVVDEFGNIRAATVDDVVVGVTGGFVPPTAPGSQGVLNIFPEGQTTARELRGMMEQPTQPVALLQPEGVTGEVPVTPNLDQDVLPLDTGLAPFRLEQPTPPAPTGTLAGNEQLAALQDALARRQAQGQQFAAVPPQVTPEVSAREQRLAESEPFLDVMGTEGRLVPEPQVGATMAEASQAWLDTKVGRGVRNWNQLSENVRNQWIDALNGNYTADNLKQIKRDLSAAESAARLTRTTPRTVVTGAITPAPVAPKPAPKPKRKVRAPKKPEAAKVPSAKQPGARGEALRRGGRERPAGAGRAAAQAQAAPAPVQNAQEPTVQDVRRDPQYKEVLGAITQAQTDGFISAKERREFVAELLQDGDFELVRDTLRSLVARRKRAAEKKTAAPKGQALKKQRPVKVTKLPPGEARGLRQPERPVERTQAEPETVETVTATDEDYAEISKDISAARNSGDIQPLEANVLQDMVRKRKPVGQIRTALIGLTNTNKTLTKKQEVNRRDFLAGVAATIVLAAGVDTKAFAKGAAPKKMDLKAIIDGLSPTEAVSAALQWIADNSTSAFERRIAAKLLRNGMGDTVLSVQDSVAGNLYGLSEVDPNGRSVVTIFSPQGINVETVLHELIHAYIQQRWAGLSAYLPSNKRLVGDTTDRNDKLVREIQDLWIGLNAAIEQNFPSIVESAEWRAALGDPDELLSWAMTNPDVQAFMRSIDPKGNPVKTPKNSMWEAFKKWVMELLGLKYMPSEATALDRILQLGEDLIDSGAAVRTGVFTKAMAKAIEAQSDFKLVNERRVDEMIDGMPASLRDPVRTVTDFFSGSGVRTVARFALRDQVLRLAENLGIKTVARFSAATAARRTTLTRFEQPYLKWAEDYKRLPRNEQGMDPGSVNNIIQRMTSEDKWAFTPDYFEGADRDVTVTVDPELRALYDRLSPEGKRSVQEAFRLNYNQLREMQDATITSVASEYDALIEGAETDAAKEKLRNEKAATLKRYKSMLNWDRAKPYAPLRVNGDWVVVGRSQRMIDALDPDTGDPKLVYQLEESPDDYFVTFASTRGEAAKMARNIEGDFTAVQFFPKAQAEQELYGGGDVMFAFQKLENLLDDATSVEGADAALDPEARERAKIRREMQQGLRNSIANLKLQIMANNSIRKAELRRRGINQGHVDMVATTLSHGRSSAQFIASVKHNDKILDALRAMRREVRTYGKDREAKQTVYNAILGHYMAGLQPQPQNTLVDKLTSFSSSWMLLLSPSYYLQQAMQNMMLTMPSLAARYGYRDTTDAFKAAYEQVTKAWVDTGITGQLNLDLIDEQYRPLAIFISESGVLDVGLDREMGSLTAESGGTYSKPFEKATGALRNLTRKIEAINRLSAAIATYDLSRSGNRGAPVTVDARAYREYKKDFEETYPDMSPLSQRQYAAALEALDVINTTHGDYSFENASDIFRNPLGRVALQFQKFRMIVAGLYVRAFYNAFMDPSLSAAERRVARRVLMYTTGHAAIMGGLLGSPAAAIFALVYNILSGDDEERGDLERDIRQAVGDDTIANLLLRGVPSLAGVDMSGTLGLGNLLSVAPYADLPTDRDTYAQYVLSLTGPAIGGIGANVFDAVSLASDGNYYKGLEKLMPRGIGNASRGFREQITGETATRGDVLTQPIDLNAVEAVWSAIGLRPIARANRQYARDQFYKDEQFYQDRAADIKRAYVQAADDSNATAINALRLEWRALQQARRDRGFKTQPMLDLVKAPREKALRERRTVGGVPFTPATEGRARQITETAGTAG